MADNNLSPRQKMIGMMYLVLIAMLALNVQREILRAFTVLNEGNEASTLTAEARNEGLYNDFRFALNLDVDKTRPYWTRAELIKERADKLVEAVDSLQTRIISETEGIPIEEADTVSLKRVEALDLYDDATRILVGNTEDGRNGEAAKLKRQLLDLGEIVERQFSDLDVEAPDLPFDFSDQYTELNGMMNWEMYTFYESPLAAVVAMLSKIKNDIRTYEYNAVSALLGQIDVDDIPVDTVLARVIPNSNFVLLGEEYRSDIFLGAYSTTSQPEVLINTHEDRDDVGDGMYALDVENGMGKYSFKPSQEGLHEYRGVVKVKDKQGNDRMFPFASSFMVSKPLAVVSPTRMNVMYIGPDNPLAVSVPGIPDESISVSISGGNSIRKTGKGEYVAKLRTSTPREVEVIVRAEVDGTTREMGRMKFRIKGLPEPSFKFGKVKTTGKLSTPEILASCGIAQYSDDFIFDLPLTLQSYRIVVEKEGMISDKVNTGQCLSLENKQFIRSLRPGTQIWIEDVQIKDVNGKIWEGNPVKISVKRS